MTYGWCFCCGQRIQVRGDLREHQDWRGFRYPCHKGCKEANYPDEQRYLPERDGNHDRHPWRTMQAETTCGHVKADILKRHYGYHANSWLACPTCGKHVAVLFKTDAGWARDSLKRQEAFNAAMNDKLPDKDVQQVRAKAKTKRRMAGRDEHDITSYMDG